MSLVKRYANARAAMKNYAKSYDFKKSNLRKYDKTELKATYLENM